MSTQAEWSPVLFSPWLWLSAALFFAVGGRVLVRVFVDPFDK